MDYVQWVVAHAADLITIALAMHGVAVLIVSLTPTPKDNQVVAKVYTVIEFLAGIITKKAKK